MATYPDDRDPAELVRELYETENKDKAEPSGSQDMIGLIYPGINRLDYDYNYEGGVYPCHIESNNDPEVAQWLSRVIHILTVMPRPEGYNPLGVKNLDPKWVSRLGQAGKDCFDAIVKMDTKGLGESLNENMRCWDVLLPQNFKTPGSDRLTFWNCWIFISTNTPGRCVPAAAADIFM